MALLHLRFDDTAGFDVEERGTEAQVLVLPAVHPFVGRPHLTLADTVDVPGLPLPRWPRDDGSYADGPGPQVHDHAQLPSSWHWTAPAWSRPPPSPRT